MIKKITVASLIAAILFLYTPCIIFADQVHRVSQGETLGGIARRYGITIDSLVGNNQYLVRPNIIYPGQILIIPSTNKRAYQVKPGDTLFMISRKFGMPMSILANINKIADRNNLTAGQFIFIPNTYIVKAGDTLARISRTLGVGMTDLAQENNLRDVNQLFIGQSLIIPIKPGQEEDAAVIERTLAPVARKFPDTFLYKGERTNLKIALTFDDGPDRVTTTEVLDVLKRYNVPATFFLMGSNVKGNSDIVRRLVDEGHIVGNHSWTHPNLRKITATQLANEMQQLEDAVNEVTGLRTALMRPPYGFVSDDNIRQLGAMNYKVIKWTVDSKDWRDLEVDKVLINILPDVRGGSVILMHDYLAHESVTPEVLPELIQTLKWQGYTFVTVDELLGINAYK